jgi:hypothetical protein
MVELGVIVTSATVTVLVAQFLKRHRAPLPAYGWLGLISLAGAEFLMFRHYEPVATYFTPIAWSAYILIADAAVLAVTGRSRLHDAPVVLARMAVLSIPLWLIFEAYNLRLKNWTYAGVPTDWPGALLGYGWSFATITPAIFETADLARALFSFPEWKAWKVSSLNETALIWAGALCLVVPLAVPLRVASRTFVLVWLGFAFLLDPINRRLGLPSFLEDLAEGLPGRLLSFLAAGWICGWLWEFWNYWASAQWRYIFPMFQNLKIFAMPAPGYLGFLPFAIECFTMYVFAARVLGWIKRVE